MPEIKEEHLEMLQELVDAGVAKDVDHAFEYCLFRGFNELIPMPEESPETLAKLDEAVASLDRGEGIKFESMDAMIAYLDDRINARLAERENQVV